MIYHSSRFTPPTQIIYIVAKSFPKGNNLLSSPHATRTSPCQYCNVLSGFWVEWLALTRHSSKSGHGYMYMYMYVPRLLYRENTSQLLCFTFGSITKQIFRSDRPIYIYLSLTYLTAAVCIMRFFVHWPPMGPLSMQPIAGRNPEAVSGPPRLVLGPIHWAMGSHD